MSNNIQNLNKYLQFIAPKGSKFIESKENNKLSYLFGVGNITCTKMSSQVEYAYSKFPHLPANSILAVAYEVYGNHRIEWTDPSKRDAYQILKYDAKIDPPTQECASHKYTNQFQLYGTGSGGLIGKLTKVSVFLEKSEEDQAKIIATEEEKH